MSLMKRKINCLVCSATYMNNNSNSPHDAIYLGFLEGQKRGADKPAFIHNNERCIKKAKKVGALDKSGKFHNCIVCGHRINLSLKNLDEGGTIKQNGYLVDTNVWIHSPLPQKEKHKDLIIYNCYEQAFGHNQCPPYDIISKRPEIIQKYLGKPIKTKIAIEKEQVEIINSNSTDEQKKKDLFVQELTKYSEEKKNKRIKEENRNNNFFNIVLTATLFLLSLFSIYLHGLIEFLYPGMFLGFAIVLLCSFVYTKVSGNSFIHFLKRNLIAIIVTSLILTNFSLLFGGPGGIYDPCQINAFVCK